VVNVKAMMGMLDHRDALTLEPQHRNQALNQRGFTRAGKASEPNNFHHQTLYFM
jgi:hypothetical protein